MSKAAREKAIADSISPRTSTGNLASHPRSRDLQVSRVHTALGSCANVQTCHCQVSMYSITYQGIVLLEDTDLKLAWGQ